MRISTATINSKCSIHALGIGAAGSGSLQNVEIYLYTV